MVSDWFRLSAIHLHQLGHQPLHYEMSEMKFESPHYTTHHYAPQQQQQAAHYQVSDAHFDPPQHLYDLNNNNDYANDHIYSHPSASIVTTSMPQQTVASSPLQTYHTLLGPRYSGGNNTSNVLMLPPNQHPRGGGSLPDLRTGDVYHHTAVSYSTVPSPPMSGTQRLFRSTSPQQQQQQHNGGDLFNLVKNHYLARKGSHLQSVCLGPSAKLAFQHWTIENKSKYSSSA